MTNAIKRNRPIGRLMGVFFLLVIAIEASAVPLVISVDMDPFTMGIQNNLTVTEGSSFQVDIRVREQITNPVPAVADFMQMIISFNDSGLLLTGGALTWGSAGLATLPLTSDFITGNLVDFGFNGVGRGAVGSAAGYASNSGLFGLFPPVLVPFVNFNGADDQGPLLSMIFTTQVGQTGSSNILVHGQQNVPILGDRTPFTLLGANVPTISNVGNVKVVALPVPGPAAIFLFAGGLIGLVSFRRQNRF